MRNLSIFPRQGFFIFHIGGTADAKVLDRRKSNKLRICLFLKRAGIVSCPLLILNDVLPVRRP